MFKLDSKIADLFLIEKAFFDDILLSEYQWSGASQTIKPTAAGIALEVPSARCIPIGDSS